MYRTKNLTPCDELKRATNLVRGKINTTCKLTADVALPRLENKRSQTGIFQEPIRQVSDINSTTKQLEVS